MGEKNKKKKRKERKKKKKKRRERGKRKTKKPKKQKKEKKKQIFFPNLKKSGAVSGKTELSLNERQRVFVSLFKTRMFLSHSLLSFTRGFGGLCGRSRIPAVPVAVEDCDLYLLRSSLCVGLRYRELAVAF